MFHFSAVHTAKDDGVQPAVGGSSPKKTTLMTSWNWTPLSPTKRPPIIQSYLHTGRDNFELPPNLQREKNRLVFLPTYDT